MLLVKKLDNLKAACAPHFAYYIFCPVGIEVEVDLVLPASDLVPRPYDFDVSVV
jgi:hypothetical protein